MKIYLKILSVFLAAGCLLPMACKKDVQKTEEIPGASNPVIVQPQNRLVPTSMGTGSAKMTFSYTTDFSLYKIEYGDGSSTILELSASGQPQMFHNYTGAKETAFTQYKVDDKGRIIRGTKYKLTPAGATVLSKFEISYQSDSRIATISYYVTENEREKFKGTEKRVYADNGNLLSELSDSGIVRASYSYDDKNGLFKNVKYHWLFAIEAQNNLFHSSENNISASTYPLAPSDDQSFGYTYNTDQYPETITSQISGTKLSYKVSYKTLK